MRILEEGTRKSKHLRTRFSIPIFLPWSWYSIDTSYSFIQAPHSIPKFLPKRTIPKTFHEEGVGHPFPQQRHIPQANVSPLGLPIKGPVRTTAYLDRGWPPTKNISPRSNGRAFCDHDRAKITRFFLRCSLPSAMQNAQCDVYRGEKS